MDWLSLPTDWSLADGEVHVVRSSLRVPDNALAQCARLLSADETVKAKRYVFDIHRRRYTAGRGILRLLLGRALQAPPQALVFEQGKNGKPFLSSSKRWQSLQFNVSHSEDEALYAFSWHRAMGVDVECIRPIDHHALAEHSFSLAERNALKTVPADALPWTFFTCWSRKEAYIKARGDGLAFPLDAFEVEILPGRAPALLANHLEPNDVLRWNYHELPPIPEARSALCVEGVPSAVHFWRWAL